MTLKDLERISSLKAARAKLQARRAELWSTRGQSSSPMLDGMPKGGGISRRVEKIAAQIADLDAAIQEYDVEIILAKCEAQKFISTIPDPRIRLILSGRFVDGLKWADVARMISRTKKVGAVKTAYMRFKASQDQDST